MISDLKPYPEMKGTSIPWMGELPASWSVRRNGSLFVQRIETGFADLPILEVSLRTGVRVREFGGSSRKQMMEDRAKYKRASCGDVAYNMMRMWQGAVGVAPVDGLVSPAYVVASPLPGVSPNYFSHLYRTDAYMGEVDNYSRGIVKDRNRLYWEQFKQIQTPCPPTAEQAAIVRFLDHADRKIRRYIRAKQRLIKLLEEQKNAIIQRAVTRGLDPNVRLKPSGVEWLGDVPEHWEVAILGRLLSTIGQGWSPVAAEGQISPEQWAVLTLSSVKQGRFNPGAIKPVSSSTRIPDGIEVFDGDLLLTRSNTRELVGDVCIVAKVRPKTVMCDLIYRLTPNPVRIESTFLVHQLLSQVGRRQIEQAARGSSGTMPKISQRHIRSWHILCPPLKEQSRISAFVDRESDQANVAIDSAQHEIGLLREYRIRLIADVVTGKLDVREAAAQLPDDDQELPPIVELDEIRDTEEVGLVDLDEAPEDVEV